MSVALHILCYLDLDLPTEVEPQDIFTESLNMIPKLTKWKLKALHSQNKKQ